MVFIWSPYAHTLLRVFAPWQPDDALPASELADATGRLGAPLPDNLSRFFRSWGRRVALTQRTHSLFLPGELTIVGGVLIFAAEEQGVWWWGICMSVRIA